MFKILFVFVNTNEFAPRVLTAISNSKEFDDSFSCERGSRMNPIEKCELW